MIYSHLIDVNKSFVKPLDAATEEQHFSNVLSNEIKFLTQTTKLTLLMEEEGLLYNKTSAD
jgi:hypothetical protein